MEKIVQDLWKSILQHAVNQLKFKNLTNQKSPNKLLETFSSSPTPSPSILKVISLSKRQQQESQSISSDASTQINTQSDFESDFINGSSTTSLESKAKKFKISLQSELEFFVLKGIRNIFSFYSLDEHVFLSQLKSQIKSIQHKIISDWKNHLNSISKCREKIQILIRQIHSYPPTNPRIANNWIHSTTSKILDNFKQKYEFDWKRNSRQFHEKISNQLKFLSSRIGFMHDGCISQIKSFFHCLCEMKSKLDEKRNALLGKMKKQMAIIGEKYSPKNFQILLDKCKNHLYGTSFQTFSATTTTTSASARQILICLSGLPASCCREKLTEKIITLGGKLVVGGEFHEGITHVVSSATFPKTMRLLAASLLCKWIVSLDWVEDSFSCGRWLSESRYGFKNTPRGSSMYQGLPFFISEEFLNENSIFYSRDVFVAFFKQLVKCHLVDDPSSAAFVMCSKLESNGRSHLSWSQFIQTIPTSASTLSSS